MEDNSKIDPNEGYKKEDLTELHNFTDKFFYEGLWGIGIFGTPAAIAVIFGRQLDNHFETHKTITLVLLLVGFILSWMIILKRNKKIVEQYRQIRKRMEENKTK